MTTAASAADPADRPITLVELREIVAPTLATGRKLVSLRAVQAWASRGVFGNRLKTVRVGGKRFTRLVWFHEFQAAVNGDTASELGRPGRPAPLDGKRRPTPKRETQMGLFDERLAGNAAMLRAVEDARAAVNPTPADPLAGPTAADLAGRSLAAKERFDAATAAGDGDAAVRAVISRMAVDPVFRLEMDLGPAGFGRDAAAGLLAAIAAGADPTAAGEVAVRAINDKYAGNQLHQRIAAGVFLDVVQARTVEQAGE